MACPRLVLGMASKILSFVVSSLEMGTTGQRNPSLLIVCVVCAKVILVVQPGANSNTASRSHLAQMLLLFSENLQMLRGTDVQYVHGWDDGRKSSLLATMRVDMYREMNTMVPDQQS